MAVQLPSKLAVKLHLFLTVYYKKQQKVNKVKMHHNNYKAIRPRGYKTFSCLTQLLIKGKMVKNKDLLALKLSDVAFMLRTL